MLELGLSTRIFNEFEPVEHLLILMQNGIEYVELSTNVYPFLSDTSMYRRLKRAIRQTGIRVNSIHVPFDQTLDLSHPDQNIRFNAIDTASICLERAVDLGAGNIVLHPSSEPIDDEDRIQRLAYSVTALTLLEDQAPPDGSPRLAIENLPRTCIGRDSTELLNVLKWLEPDRFGVCQDVNHANLREELIDATRAYGHRVTTVHVSDNDGWDDRHWLPGRGVIPFRDWARTLLELGYTGPFVYEVSPWCDVEGRPLGPRELVRGIKRNAFEVFDGIKPPFPR